MDSGMSPVVDWAESRGLSVPRLLFLISGPSGVGKTSVVRGVLETVQGLKKVVTTTTRPRRPGELHGANYNFVAPDEFQRMVEQGDFIESKFHFGQRYGLTFRAIERDRRLDAIFDVDTEGMREVVAHVRERVIAIFLGVLRLDDLRQRLTSRGDLAQDDIEQRLEKASRELASAIDYEYFVLNENLQEATDAIKAIIWAERCRRDRGLFQELLNQEATVRSENE